MVKCLLDRGATIDVKNDRRETPLDLANTKGNIAPEHFQFNILKKLTEFNELISMHTQAIQR